MIAKDIMTPNPITIGEDKTVADAANLMVNNKFSVLPVVDAAGKLVGIITESDFVGKEVSVPHALAAIKQLFGQKFFFRDVEEMYNESKTRKIKDVMTRDPKTVRSETSVDEVVNFMIKQHLKRIPVVDGGKLVGILTRKDIIKAFAA